MGASHLGSCSELWLNYWLSKPWLWTWETWACQLGTFSNQCLCTCLYASLGSLIPMLTSTLWNIWWTRSANLVSIKLFIVGWWMMSRSPWQTHQTLRFLHLVIIRPPEHACLLSPNIPKLSQTCGFWFWEINNIQWSKCCKTIPSPLQLFAMTWLTLRQRMELWFRSLHLLSGTWCHRMDCHTWRTGPTQLLMCSQWGMRATVNL